MAIQNNELNKAMYGSYQDVFDKFRALANEHSGMPMQNVLSAFMGISNNNYAIANPYIQNRRVKAISSLPVEFTKDKVAEMITKTYDNEQPLRQVAHALEYTAYPLFHIRKTYQSLMTYHSYVSPLYADKDDTKQDDFWREWKLIDKLSHKMQLKENMRRIVGQTLVEGKVFYATRIKVDKAHNKVNHAFMQQLPSDWVKIVGYNNVSKYTVAFNMMYFVQPGCQPNQFGDLFDQFSPSFGEVIADKPKGLGDTLVYASKGIDLKKFNLLKDAGLLNGSPEVYNQNGVWYYWVTLPVDRVFTFESDDVSAAVVSPFTGLFLNMIQLSQMEQIQLSLIQNPLVACLTGEIPYRDNKENSAEDAYKLSPAGRAMFEAYWYQMLANSNTSGIGWYAAPVNNMKLQTLSEAPSAMDIVHQGYADTMAQAGLTSLISISEEPKVGVSDVSMKIESAFMETVYSAFERMMAAIIDSLNLKYEWAFHCFGSIATDDKERERTIKEMTYGLLPATLRYLALNDMSIFDDLGISDSLLSSEIMDKRRPLVTSFSAKQSDSGLPPQIKQDINPGGRGNKADTVVEMEGDAQ